MNNKTHNENDYFQVALGLMNSKPPQYLAASCVLKYLYENSSSQTNR